jgi:hypothetical protein
LADILQCPIYQEEEFDLGLKTEVFIMENLHGVLPKLGLSD